MLENDVRASRIRLGWSQEELASRSGVSRTGISAIETGRLVPSTAAALSLAEPLGCRVEDLLRLPGAARGEAVWAWPPRRDPRRYWRAELSGATRHFPVEANPLG